jgi:DNA-binding response OmpR family regulator
MNRILIAEDEARLASFLEKGLRSNGFVTTTASDGPTALALARDDDFDLLILDLGLPGLDGMTILRTLRAQGQRLPVLILSARDEVADKVAGLEHGADDYVAKPIGWVSTLSSASGCRWMRMIRSVSATFGSSVKYGVPSALTYSNTSGFGSSSR